MTEETNYDAIVIGGGPSGCAYAITLARKGYRVLVLERDRHPKFHIGESLLPYTVDMLEQLGVLPQVLAAPHALKLGVELTGVGGNAERLAFADIGEGLRPWAISLERAPLDKLLIDTARAVGAVVREEAAVTELVFTGPRISGVRYTCAGRAETAAARFVIDASGRAGVIARGLNLRKVDQRLRMAAVFKHFGGVVEANNPGVQGDTQLGMHERGWVWAIPLSDDAISIGAVAPVEEIKRLGPETVFENYLRATPRVRARLEGATAIRELSGERNFEYHADTLAGPGFFLVGDSGSFTDPMFSGGVFLGLATGKQAAEYTIECLADGLPEAVAAERYQAFYKTGYETYFRLIHAVYDRRYPVLGYLIYDLNDGLDPKWRVRTVAGEFWAGSNPYIDRLRSQYSWDVFEKYDPLYECPVYARGSFSPSSL
ncbi:NAD(P)/FAD-dependent oxidoreductase [Nocardia sp. SYP-A9097]|uniref:NAD(P)/FAD-dependent oxidoreductase n=1 Tax=Nocardia sp. SYP-A9097 TaxID=2663237 RepID=UPI0018914EC9|nr:NAD(P)/FAD-dependent oxidoreductase [Nocardia sp. SYP-A9097]